MNNGSTGFDHPDFDHSDFDFSDVDLRDAVAYIRAQPGIAAAMGSEPGEPRTFRGDPLQIWTAQEALDTLAPTLEARWCDVRGRWIRRIVGGRAVVAFKMRDGMVVGVYGEQATWRILREDNVRLGLQRAGIRGHHLDLLASAARDYASEVKVEASAAHATAALKALDVATRDLIDAEAAFLAQLGPDAENAALEAHMAGREVDWQQLERDFSHVSAARDVESAEGSPVAIA